MKHLIIAFVLLAGIGVAALSLVVRPAARHQENGLVVNDRIINNDELEARFSRQKQYYANREDFVKQLVTNQLLIQEAKRLGIDTEGAFREAMESFYEQSLIKVLMERKHQELPVEITEAEIDRYLALKGREVSFTLSPNGPDETSTGLNEERKESSFDTLSPAVRMNLVSVEQGAFSPPCQLDGKIVRCRLDASTDGKKTTELQTREKVRELLTTMKKEVALGNWIESLRKDASIVMPNQEGKRK